MNELVFKPNNIGVRIILLILGLLVLLILIGSAYGVYQSGQSNSFSNQLIYIGLAIFILCLAVICGLVFISLAINMGKLKIVLSSDKVSFTQQNILQPLTNQVISLNDIVAINDTKNTQLIYSGKGVIPVSVVTLLFIHKNHSMDKVNISNFGLDIIKKVLNSIKQAHPSIRLDTTIL